MQFVLSFKLEESIASKAETIIILSNILFYFLQQIMCKYFNINSYTLVAKQV